MSDVTDYLRRYRASVAAGTVGSPGIDSASILHRLDAFLSSHMGRFIHIFLVSKAISCYPVICC